MEQKGIRKDVTHFLLVPPSKNTIRAEPYKYLIDARIPRKKTITEKKNTNKYFLFTRVAYREEFALQFKKKCCFYSCDDMNKIQMGPSTAVSRYHQVLRFFMENNSPDLNDHNFPNSGYLIVCSGYQQLQVKEKNSNDITSEHTEQSSIDYVSETDQSVNDENHDEVNIE